MSRSKAGSPNDPRGKERFHEERATKVVASAQPDLEAGITAIRETVKTLKPRPGVYRMLVNFTHMMLERPQSHVVAASAPFTIR